MKGSEFLLTLEGLTPAQCDQAALDAVDAGLMMKWPWGMVPIGDAGKFTGWAVAASDYFAIGEQGDFVRIPLGANTAQAIADYLGYLLPTRKLVNLIWKAASVKLPPLPWGPPYDASMMSVERFRVHNKRIEDQRGDREGLTAGHKKDVILSNRLAADWQGVGGSVAIYGWHRLDGTPIQGPEVSLAHEYSYRDYSHGVRFMHPDAYLNGSDVRLTELLTDAKRCFLVSDEGPLKLLRQPDYKPGTMPARKPVVLPEAPAPAAGRFPFVQARNYRSGRLGGIDLVVIHTMENAEKPSAAENVAAWFAGPSAPVASAHYCVDNDSIVQCVKESDTAWAAPGANHNGVQIEHAGRAAQGDNDWNDDYSKAMLALSAALVADICQRNSIPRRWLSAEDLLKGERGIVTHAVVSEACRIAQRSKFITSPFYNKKKDKPLTDHHDPGKLFPFEDYLAAVCAHELIV